MSARRALPLLFLLTVPLVSFSSLRTVAAQDPLAQAWAALDRGQPEEALRIADQLAAAGDPSLVGASHGVAAISHSQMMRLSEAAQRWDLSARAWAQAGDPAEEMAARAAAALITIGADPARGIEALRQVESVGLTASVHGSEMARVLGALGTALGREGDTQWAQRLLWAAEGLADKSGASILDSAAFLFNRAVQMPVDAADAERMLRRSLDYLQASDPESLAALSVLSSLRSRYQQANPASRETPFDADFERARRSQALPSMAEARARGTSPAALSAVGLIGRKSDAGAPPLPIAGQPFPLGSSLVPEATDASSPQDDRVADLLDQFQAPPGLLEAAVPGGESNPPAGYGHFARALLVWWGQNAEALTFAGPSRAAAPAASRSGGIGSLSGEPEDPDDVAAALEDAAEAQRLMFEMLNATVDPSIAMPSEEEIASLPPEYQAMLREGAANTDRNRAASDSFISDVQNQFERAVEMLADSMPDQIDGQRIDPLRTEVASRRATRELVGGDTLRSWEAVERAKTAGVASRRSNRASELTPYVQSMDRFMARLREDHGRLGLHTTRLRRLIGTGTPAEIRASLDSVDAQVRRSPEELDEAFASLFEDFQAARSQANSASPPQTGAPPASLLAALPGDAVYLSFSANEEGTVGFASTADGASLRGWSLPTTGVEWGSIRDSLLREIELQVGDRDAFLRAGRSLSSLLLPADVQPLVAAAERVIISAAGTVAGLPLGLLVIEPLDDFLGLAKPTSYIESLELLQGRPNDPRPRGGEILILGNPDYGASASELGTDLFVSSSPFLRPAALAQSESEAVALAALYDVLPILGSRATEDLLRARMPSARVVHVAAHGFPPPGTRIAPLGSGVWLSTEEGSDHDGILQAWEIDGEISLQAEVVVYSACETGTNAYGYGGAGELVRSSLLAGARSVVASQWQVDDASTSRLMTSMHRHLVNGAAKDVALQQAMIETAARTDSPYHWASFQLYGDPSGTLGLDEAPSEDHGSI